MRAPSTRGFWIAAGLAFALAAPVLFAINFATWVGPCKPTARGEGIFLAYCNAVAFRDYEHGAYAYRLEPATVDHARAAQVLILGNSRAQFAFAPARERFAAAGLRVHHLGFGYGDGDAFALALIDRLGLRPRAVIINLDPFFVGPSAVAAAVLSDRPLMHLAYRVKRWMQDLQASACAGGSGAGPLCGGTAAVIDRRTDGSWITEAYAGAARIPMLPNPPAAPSAAAIEPASRALLARLGVPAGCAILTSTPSHFAMPALAAALAERLGAVAAVPDLPDLATFDGSHLVAESAARWSGAVLNEVMPVLARCAAS